jgi:hypothetical protein
VRSRIAELPAASAAPRWDATALLLGQAAQSWAVGERTAYRPQAAQGAQQAQGHAAAWAQLPPQRLKPSDSRSPDRTSATPGSLCRSGYTSPKIAQSLVPISITSNWVRRASEEPSRPAPAPLPAGERVSQFEGQLEADHVSQAKTEVAAAHLLATAVGPLMEQEGTIVQGTADDRGLGNLEL